MNECYAPRLQTADVNAVSDRQAMGYPDTHVPTPYLDLSDRCRALAHHSRSTLAGLVEDPTAPLADRLAAGRLLAILGDPRTDTLNPSMIALPGGDVPIGLDASALPRVQAEYADLHLQKAWLLKEIPRHTVRLRGFRIARYLVTNREYLDYLNACGGDPPTSWPFGHYPQERSNHPVFTVSAEAADGYARWLSKRTGRAFRLPREAEWEYAAGGCDGRAFPWGEVFDPERANTVEAGLLSSSPVGAFPDGASAFGAVDMAGNVEEYVAEDYRPYPGGGEIHDDLARSGKRYRVTRGGSFTRFRDLARCRRRHGPFPKAIYVIGFRLAEDLDASIAADERAYRGERQ